MLDQKGNIIIGDVTIEKALSGMRGVKGLACDTSYVTADEGLHIRGTHILDLVHIVPEEVLHLLLTGDIPNKAMLADLQSDLKNRNEVPSYIWDILNNMPKDSHPMAMFNTAILSMQKESQFYKAYDAGVSKTKYWHTTLEDSLNIIAKLPAIADDSGLCVPVIGGEPGIYSARWAGRNKDFSVAMEKINKKLFEMDSEHTNAHFFCALAVVWTN